MFCTKCGNKVEDDALFCTSCGEKLRNTNPLGDGYTSKPQFTSPISKAELKDHTFLAFSLLRHQISAPKLLQERLSFSKNLSLLISLICLLPLVLVVFTAIAFNLSTIAKFGGNLPISLLFKIFFIGTIFLGLIIFGSGSLMILFSKGKLSFDNLVRAATLPTLNLCAFTIAFFIVGLITPVLSSIFLSIGYLTFLLSYFNGLRYFLSNSELLPISFASSLFITTFISVLISTSLIGEFFYRSLF